MEGGVEDSDLSRVGQRCVEYFVSHQVCRHVKRTEFRQILDILDNFVVEDSTGRIDFTAV